MMDDKTDETPEIPPEPFKRTASRLVEFPAIKF